MFWWLPLVIMANNHPPFNSFFIENTIDYRILQLAIVENYSDQCAMSPEFSFCCPGEISHGTRSYFTMSNESNIPLDGRFLPSISRGKNPRFIGSSLRFSIPWLQHDPGSSLQRKINEVLVNSRELLGQNPPGDTRRSLGIHWEIPCGH